MKDYYQILGLKTHATSAEIKTAYRKLSKKFHPDVNQGDKFFEELFKEIQSAYEVLSDEKKRAIYDARPGYRNEKSESDRATQERPEPHSPRSESNTQPKQEPDKDKKATGTTSPSQKSKKGSSVWGIIIFIFVGGFFHAVFKNINKNSDSSTFAPSSETYDYVDTIAMDTPLVKPTVASLSRKELKLLLSSFEGVWSGSAYQYDVQETWTIRLTCRDGVISVKYPSLGCAGDLTVMESTASALTLKENLTSQGSCYDNGVIVLSIEEDGRIKAFFNSSENTNLIALGYLKKIRR